MNITSQFFITNYIGSLELDLMSIPASFAGNIAKTSEYNRFIEAISSIYAAQSFISSSNAAGEIPVFWTVRSSSIDAAGNTNYVYKASPDSTLKKLQPKQSYYIILRDTSYLPLKMPIAGYPLIGFVDTNLFPNVKKTSIPTKILQESGNNIYDFTPIIENLQPSEKYSYNIYRVDSNWPIILIPNSGQIRPSEREDLIDIRVNFCAATGSCPNGADNVVSYTKTPPTSRASDLYGIFQIGISPISYSGEEILSDQFTVFCQDCLPQLTVSVPGKIQSIPVTNPGVGYKSSPDIRISADPEDPIGQDSVAQALFYADNKTFVISVNNSLPDQLYLFKPSVLINGGGGTGAVAKTVLSQQKSLETQPGSMSEIFFSVENMLEDYRYEIRSKLANYPTVISTVSGVLTRSLTNKATSYTKLMFCDPINICPSGTPGLLGYSIETGLFSKQSVPFVDLEIVLSSAAGNQQRISNLLSVYCPLCEPIGQDERFSDSNIPKIQIEAQTKQHSILEDQPEFDSKNVRYP